MKRNLSPCTGWAVGQAKKQHILIALSGSGCRDGAGDGDVSYRSRLVADDRADLCASTQTYRCTHVCFWPNIDGVGMLLTFTAN